MVSTTTALLATGLTLAAFAGLGAWYSRGRVRSVEDFISARNSTEQGPLTATLIASGMGAWILFGPAEAGVGVGLTAALGYGVGSAVPMVAYVFVGPRIRSLMPEGHTLTEFAAARYGRAMYAYVLVVSVAYMFIFLAADLTAITNALKFVADVPRWQTGLLVAGFVLAYTTYGGLRASIVTDTAQALLVMPLLVVSFGGALVLLGGPASIHAEVVASSPALLDPGFVPGLKFGATLVLAIFGAEMLNQAWWQRVYAGSDAETVRRSFAVTAVAVIPIVFVAGFAGTIAAGLGLVGDAAASNAFLLLLDAAFPPWIPFVVVLLATVLVASTADTLFNALASIVTADLPRLLNDPDDDTLTLAARALTLVAGVGAVYVGVWARSVLSLFLLADLLAAATFVPLLYGLYSQRVEQYSALTASVAGLLAGLLFFPGARGVLTDISLAKAVVAGLPAPALLTSFVLAVAVSTTLVVLGARVADARFDHARLASDVHVLNEGEREVSD